MIDEMRSISFEIVSPLLLLISLLGGLAMLIAPRRVMSGLMSIGIVVKGKYYDPENGTVGLPVVLGWRIAGIVLAAIGAGGLLLIESSDPTERSLPPAVTEHVGAQGGIAWHMLIMSLVIIVIAGYWLYRPTSMAKFMMRVNHKRATEPVMGEARTWVLRAVAFAFLLLAIDMLYSSLR